MKPPWCIPDSLAPAEFRKEVGFFSVSWQINGQVNTILVFNCSKQTINLKKAANSKFDSLKVALKVVLLFVVHTSVFCS